MPAFEFVVVCVAVRVAVRVAVHDAVRVAECRRVYCSVLHQDNVLQGVAECCRVHQSDGMFFEFRCSVLQSVLQCTQASVCETEKCREVQSVCHDSISIDGSSV